MAASSIVKAPEVAFTHSPPTWSDRHHPTLAHQESQLTECGIQDGTAAALAWAPTHLLAVHGDGVSAGRCCVTVQKQRAGARLVHIVAMTLASDKVTSTVVRSTCRQGRISSSSSTVIAHGGTQTPPDTCTG